MIHISKINNFEIYIKHYIHRKAKLKSINSSSSIYGNSISPLNKHNCKAQYMQYTFKMRNNIHEM